MNSLKLKIYPGDNVKYCCAEILVDSEHLESSGAFKLDHLVYITCTFQDTSDPRFRIWSIHKYKQGAEFIKKLLLCDMDVISPEDLITCQSLLQEATCEYRDLFYSKQWEPDTDKEKSQDQPSLPKSYTVAIEYSLNKSLKQVDFGSHRSRNASGSGGGSSVNSSVTRRDIFRNNTGQR